MQTVSEKDVLIAILRTIVLVVNLILSLLTTNSTQTK